MVCADVLPETAVKMCVLYKIVNIFIWTKNHVSMEMLIDFYYCYYCYYYYYYYYYHYYVITGATCNKC